MHLKNNMTKTKNALLQIGLINLTVHSEDTENVHTDTEYAFQKDLPGKDLHD